jgi:hypothetical protein
LAVTDSSRSGRPDVVKVLGEAQPPRIFCLILMFAFLLLVVVSSRPADAVTDPVEPRVAHDVGVLLALGEALEQQRSAPAASPVFPALADGGPAWLKSVSVRRARSLKRKLAVLKSRPGSAHEHYRQLALETDRLLVELAAFDPDTGRAAGLQRSLERLDGVRSTENGPAHAAIVVAD